MLCKHLSLKYRLSDQSLSGSEEEGGILKVFIGIRHGAVWGEISIRDIPKKPMKRHQP
jgi:hypothetical protein